MNRYLATVAYLLVAVPLPQTVHAWIPSPSQQKTIVTRWAADVAGTDKSLEMDGNPCWEDLYDDDCVMTNAAAASFVASRWIQSMPCGEGIKDCDMPEDLKTPETRPEAGIDHVDVMDMLGLKRAKPVDK